MLTPEAAAVSLHLQTSFLLLIGKTTLVYVALCIQVKLHRNKDVDFRPGVCVFVEEEEML